MNDQEGKYSEFEQIGVTFSDLANAFNAIRAEKWFLDKVEFEKIYLNKPDTPKGPPLGSPVKLTNIQLKEMIRESINPGETIPILVEGPIVISIGEWMVFQNNTHVWVCLISNGLLPFNWYIRKTNLTFIWNMDEHIELQMYKIYIDLASEIDRIRKSQSR